MTEPLERSPETSCVCCDEGASVLLRCTRFRADDLILECDVCISFVCEDCADQSSPDGIVICTDCYQTETIRRHSMKEAIDARRP